MDKSKLGPRSAYAGNCFILTTKHAKSVAIAPPLWDTLEASVIEYVVDTDRLGTFTGEVAREGNALSCARRKCELALSKLGSRVEFALASEGSFGLHPFIPFLPCDHEILYFIDQRRQFHLHLVHLSERTNYATQAVTSWEQLQAFAKTAQFPSHALILRPGNRETMSPIFKGIDTMESLEDAFKQSHKASCNGDMWVETDMRAHMNTSRMAVIGELAAQLAERLAALCPQCETPGWGKIRVEAGLICRWCGSNTEMIKSEIFGCTKCQYEESRARPDGLEMAEPGQCGYCNP